VTADRGAVLSLVLDAVDPRLGVDQRAESVACALDVDPTLAGVAWAGMLFGMLDGIRGQFGAAGVDEIMGVLASVAVGLVGVDVDGVGS
jgi:hypothetical protein